jgi:predicted nucleotidyltransferase
MKGKDKADMKKLGVGVVYLFGSKAIGRDSPLSDVDIGVVLKTGPPIDTRSLYHQLYSIFSEQYPASRVDIVFLQNAPLALQFSAVKTGKVLFEEEPRFTADYEKSVVDQYLDFRPVLDLFDRAAGKRYAPT